MSEGINGTIKISDDVIATIASVTARDVEGVAGMSQGIAGEIYEFIGKKVPTKGVKIENADGVVTVDVYIIVNYGVKINEVAGEIQVKVKAAIEEMTNLDTTVVNVHVQGVKIAKEDADEVVDQIPEASEIQESEME